MTMRRGWPLIEPTTINLPNINDVDGTLYNAQGKEIKHFRKSDMSDFEADGTALASDSRQKVKGFILISHPYSVVFEEKDELSGTIYIPDWQPRNG